MQGRDDDFIGNSLLDVKNNRMELVDSGVEQVTNPPMISPNYQ